jgi:hypothetical protein
MDTNSFSPKPKSVQSQPDQKASEKPLEKTTSTDTIKLYNMVSLFKDYKNDRS